MAFAMAHASMGVPEQGGIFPPDIPGLVLWLRADLGITYVQGPVVATGTTPPTVTLTGTPASPTNSIVLTCTAAGTQTTATFSWTLNGVAQTPFTAAATVVLPGTGITANFPVGLYTNTPSADTYTSVVTVSAWADRSGLGNNFAQATASKQPQLTLADPVFGGQSDLYTNSGLTQLMVSSAALALAQPYSVLIVGSVVGSTNNCAIGCAATTPYFGITQTVAFAATATQKNANLIGSGNSPQCMAASINGASSVVYGTLSTNNSGAQNTGAAALAGNMSLFAIPLVSAYQCTIAEVLIYNSALAQAQIAQLFKYFGARYGQAWS